MARAFHLLTYANKACPDTEARYFMSINTWGIKYIVTSSFNLILNSQKKKKPFTHYYTSQLAPPCFFSL